MSEERLKQCFTEALGIAAECVRDELTYNSIPEWDSTAHMTLVAELEEVFSVSLDTDEILALSSVAVARDILSKQGVSF